MTRVASRRHGLEPAVGSILVAGIAVDRGVCAGQRETVVVILNILVRHLPSPHGVALFAIGAQLAAMNVRVTILAVQSDVGEDHLHVTLRARDRSVHATERVFGLIVIKLWNRANGLPCTRSVAVLTGNRQIAMRTMRAPRSLRSRTFRKCEKRKNQNKYEFRFYPSAHELPLAFVLLPT